MEGLNATASAIISFSQKLEDDSSKFYEELAEMYVQDRKTFLAFAKESKKNKVLVTRTYQETITDAIVIDWSNGRISLKCVFRKHCDKCPFESSE